MTIDDRWPTSKKEVRETVAKEPERVKVIATSLYGGEHNGRITDMPIGKQAAFAGPDVHVSRKFYGTIKWVSGKLVCV